MGIFDTLKEKSSQEEGFRAVDKNNRYLASFAADTTSGEGDSITSDIEILRGELAGILYDLTKEDVKYVFGEMVDSVEETGDEIGINFANGRPKETFDLLVAADGIGSKIRRTTFGSDAADIKSLLSYVIYFSVPPGDTDSMWARGYKTKGGRTLVVRPDNQGRTRAFLVLTAYDDSDPRLPRLARAMKEGTKAQMALTQELFQDAGWEVARLLKGMHGCDDFYFQHVAQVRRSSWSKGRVAVVGDAGYAPSPFTGMGTSIAFIGAFVLAGEISKQPHDIPAALKEYERVLRPYVEDIQSLTWGVPWILCPQSMWGNRVLEFLCQGIGMVQGTWFSNLLWKAQNYFTTSEVEAKFKLPEYEMFEK